MDDVEAAAAQAPLAGKIRSFARWVGAGRKLTQTGKITLADARQLVELLETGDAIDSTIGDRVFKTTSSTELGGLTRIAEWAKAARLVRVTGNRLALVKKNAALLDRPLDLVLALVKAYPSLGTSLFPRGHYRQSLVGDEFADIGDACGASAARAAPGDPGRYGLAGLSSARLPDRRRRLRARSGG